MPQATFSVCMNDKLKREFDTLCADFGMNATTAINVFAKAVVCERKIPFEIVASEPVVSLKDGRAKEIVFDEECPEITPEKALKFRSVNPPRGGWHKR